jgi:hypothetical protein
MHIPEAKYDKNYAYDIAFRSIFLLYPHLLLDRSTLSPFNLWSSYYIVFQ